MAVVERAFRVMGSEASIVALGLRPAAVDRAVRFLEELERRWSRFLDQSDVSRANRAAGRWVEVDPVTVRLFEEARRGWEATGGRFDPTVLRTVVARGYAQSLDVQVPPFVEALGQPARGFEGIRIDPRRNAIRLDPDVGFDPGAIGKGLAADMAVELLARLGAGGAVVNIGGDLRVSGDGPDGRGWSVAVEHPFDRSAEVAVLHVVGGGVATSTARHGRWTVDGIGACHVVDPHTGAVVATDVASATVVAAQAWMAEVVATAALVSGMEVGLHLIESLDLDGLLVDHTGRVASTVRLGAAS